MLRSFACLALVHRRRWAACARALLSFAMLTRGVVRAGEDESGGHAGHVSYDTIPAVVYTHPEFASVGISSEQATEKGIEVREGVFPFAGNGRARTMGETDGAVKILADAKTSSPESKNMIRHLHSFHYHKNL